VVTCGLTACTPGSAPGPTLGIEYGKPLPLLLLNGAYYISHKTGDGSFFFLKVLQPRRRVLRTIKLSIQQRDNVTTLAVAWIDDGSTLNDMNAATTDGAGKVNHPASGRLLCG